MSHATPTAGNAPAAPAPAAAAHALAATAGSALTLSLGQDLTIPRAAQHHATLMETLLSRTGDLHLDLSNVDDFDSSGLQLLLSAQRTLHERGDRLHLPNPSGTVRDALLVFGLQHLLHTEAAA